MTTATVDRLREQMDKVTRELFKMRELLKCDEDRVDVISVRLVDRIVAAMRESEQPMTCPEIAKATDIDQASIRWALYHYSDIFEGDRTQPKKVMWSIKQDAAEISPFWATR